MRFSHIKLENWRNFRQVDVSLQNRAFLVGPNASGKSNFLDVFRFLRDLAIPGGGFQSAVGAHGGVTRIRNLAARRPSEIIIEATILGEDYSNWRYRIAFTQDSQRQPYLKEEKAWHGKQVILDRPDNQDAIDPERLGQTQLEQTFANLKFRKIAEFFSSTRYLHLVPQVVREPESWARRSADPYGGDFLEQIARKQKRTQEARLRRIEAALKIAAPQLSKLKLEKDDRGNPHLKANYEHWRSSGAWQDEDDFSDGTLRLLGLLWSLLDGTGPLLLEEPELSLHPGVVRHIPQMMVRIQRDRKRPRQVFLSTHSSDLLHDEGIASDEVLLCVPSEREGTTIMVGAQIKEVQQLLDAGLTMAEIVIPRTTPTDAYQLSLFGD